MPRYGLLPVVLPLLAVLGCSSPAPDSDLPPGVELVESDAPLQPPGSWTVSPEPVLEIGQVEGDPRYLFSRIPQPGTVRFSDGRLAVCDNEDRTVRFFDPAGRFLSEIGGKGEGPGEFASSLAACVRYREGLAAIEFTRASFFEGDGRFTERSADLQRPQALAIADILSDGSLLVNTADRSSDPGTEVIGQPFILRAGVRIQDPEGRLSQWEVPVSLGMMARTETGYIAGQPFGPMQVLLAFEGGFLYGWGDPSYEFSIFDREGQPVRIVRRAWRPEPLTAADRDTPPRAPLPEHYAAFDRALFDSSGHVWVHRVHPAGEWDVFDPSGRWVTTVTMPEGLTVHAIGPDYILGVWADDLGVEYVRMYGLDRGAGAD